MEWSKLTQAKTVACKCGNDLVLDGLVRCNSCLKWWHRKCVDMSIGDASHDFVCSLCSEDFEQLGACGGPDEIDITARKISNLKLNASTLSSQNNNREKRETSRNTVATENVANEKVNNPPNIQNTTVNHSSNDQISRNRNTSQPQGPATLSSVEIRPTEAQNLYNAAITMMTETRRLHEEARLERERNERQYAELMANMNEILRSFTASQQPPHATANNSVTADGPQIQPPRMNAPANADQLTPALQAALLRDQRVDSLPRFDGRDSQQWIKFEAVYNYQKQSGLPRDKLISNLAAALYGEASDLVGEHLLFREDPDVIMTELANYYGDADRVIDTLTKNVLSAKPPRDQPKHLLINFAVLVKRLVTTITYYGRQEQLSSIYIERNIVKKLRDEHKDLWGQIKRETPTANLENLSRFLLERAKDISAEMPDSRERRLYGDRTPRSVNFNDANTEPDYYAETSEEAATDRTEAPLLAFNRGVPNVAGRRLLKCFDCGDGHWLITCKIFLNRTVEEREKLATRKRVCTACLASTEHEANNCDKRRSCGIANCNLQHHWLLHKLNVSTTIATAVTPIETDDTTDCEATFNCAHISSRAHYGIVPLNVKTASGVDKTIYAMLDLGAGVSIMSHQLFVELGLKGSRTKLNIKWTDASTCVRENSFRVALKVSVPGGDNEIVMNNIHTFDGLDLPAQSQSKRDLDKFQHLVNVPVPEYKNAKPQLLIGLPHAYLCTGEMLIKGAVNEPVVNKTKLGWVVYGSFNHYETVASIVQIKENKRPCKSCDDRAHEIIQDYLSIESHGIQKLNKPSRSLDERRVEEVINKTLTYNSETKHYSIGLFWANDDARLQNNYAMALNRLKATEKSLKANGLLEWANAKFDEMIAKGYIRKATNKDLTTNWKRKWYLPIFVIVNQNKQPPKPRLVLDGAAAVNGKSLNSYLLTGPDLTASMISVLIQMRERRYVTTGDACEMFHQVEIIPDDQQCQRVLWRYGNQLEEPTIYIFQVMTFGLKSSPATAQVIKNQHADKYAKSHPNAARAAKYNTFVDDYVKSFDTKPQAVHETNETIYLFGEAGFRLVNFQSNDLDILSQLPAANVKQELVSLNFNSQTNYISKLLGLKWDPFNDWYEFQPTSSELLDQLKHLGETTTKRQLLKTVMKLFDPLGLIGHILVQGRIILQKVWRHGTAWDESIPSDLVDDVKRWAGTILIDLPNLRIPRWYAPVVPETVNSQLHMFCDASDEAMAAAGYLRFQDGNNVWVTLVMSKTKVMPIRTLTIPRAELTAAVLATRLGNAIRSYLSFEVNDTTYWTDSKCVLTQIITNNKLQPFFAARVGEIKEQTTSQQWRHVPSTLNPVDGATKNKPGATDPENIFFTGPDYLKLDESFWPKRIVDMNHQPTCIALIQPVNFGSPLLNTISDHLLDDWRKLRRVVAIRVRFVRAKFLAKPFEHEFLTVEELLFAEELIAAQIQAEAFPNEYAALQQGEDIQVESKLHQLTPFKSQTGAIRMKSRLQNSSLSYAAKNPLILPNKHRIVDALVKHIHQRCHHQNEDTIIAELRKKAWVFNARKLVRRISKHCSVCKVLRAQATFTLEGDLPYFRVDSDAYPFEHCGVDCFGPIYTVFGRGRTARYGLIFVCMVTRAIHLELLEDMSTKSLLSAIQIFANVYGPPRRFYSDQGRNFVGLANVFQRAATRLAPQLVENIGVTWFFNPARTPHWGGPWERMIQSVKRMMSVCEDDDEIHNDFYLRNLFAQVAARINERPLTHTPVNPNDDLPLTPSDFLRGRVRHSIIQTEGNHTADLNIGKVHAMADRLMKRWARDYLPVIGRRTKWFTDNEPFRVDDIVLLVDFSKSRLQWRRGIIVQIYPGRDGRPRVADVRYIDEGEVRVKRTGIVNLAHLKIRSTPPTPLDDGGVDEGRVVMDEPNTTERDRQ